MSENNELDELRAKLEALIQRHNGYSSEIRAMNDEIKKYRASLQEHQQIVEEPKPKPFENPVPKQVQTQREEQTVHTPIVSMPTFEEENIKSSIEQFIGENLINKIGIAITVIGVSIGVKYSIDNDLISPLTRIILGYLMGLGLMGFGIKLKEKYESFSAVLVSGAIAVLYFMTFAAYSFYNFIPQPVAFLLMLVFTSFSVVAATNYNRQIIAHIGLVGAYAIPFLLSDGSGRYDILFSYMTIINIGIMFIAFKRYWKALEYVAYGLTWLIFMTWYASNYNSDQHFGLALLFVTLFFAIFYIMFLAYKCIEKEVFEQADVILILSNAFIFFGIGYSILNSNPVGTEFLGLFALANAVIHFCVSLFISKQKLGDRNLFYLTMSLVLVFITIAIPVQLEGNWVVCLWACEAALLFWIGRTKQVAFYEYASFPLIIVASISMFNTWATNYICLPDATTLPLLNVNFLTNVIYVAALALIYKFHKDKRFESPISENFKYLSDFNIMIPTLLLGAIFMAFSMEISHYFNELYFSSATTQIVSPDFYQTVYNEDIKCYQSLTLILYFAVFLSILSYFNIQKIQSRVLGRINLYLNTFFLINFLIQGLLILSNLRDSYIQQYQQEFYTRSVFNIGVRYISYVFVAILFYCSYRYIKEAFLAPIHRNTMRIFELLIGITLVWITSSELITWLNLLHFGNSYKFGLSLLWGSFSLLGIAIGIWKKRKFLRIAGIVLFGLTLFKLFIYDISQLETIAKTIIFVSLGILLLIISFLYNKYKDLIHDDDEV